MSEVGCYTLDLYCDHKHNVPVERQVHQFTGQTKSECVKKAKEYGWKFHKNGTHSCRCCRGIPEKKLY
jgi:hypothetical protein